MVAQDKWGSTRSLRSRRSKSAGREGESSPIAESTDDQNPTTMMLHLLRNMEENRMTSEARMVELINRSQAANTTLYRVIPDFTKTISEFNGESGASAAREWLHRVKSAATLHSWPEEYILETARANLKGAAASWYKTVHEEVTSWTEFETRFKRTFIGIISLTERWNKMQARKQGSEETVPSYYHNKLYLCQQLNLSFAEAKEQIITGLRNKELVGALLAKQHGDSDELLHDITEFGRVLTITRDQQIKPKSAGQVKESATSVPKTRTPEKRAPAWDSQGQPRCFNCNSYGHLSKDCTQPKKQRETVKCFKCQKEGHMKKDCPGQQPVQKSTSKNTVAKVSIPGEEGSSLDKYLRNVRTAGQHVVQGMIDAASAVCTIRESIVQKTALPVQLQKRTLYGFGMNNQVTCGAVLRTSIAVDDIEADDIELVVVPDDAQCVDVLVGRTYTELPHLAYVRVGDQLHFGYSDIEPFRGLQLEAEPQRHSFVTIAENTNLLKEWHSVTKLQPEMDKELRQELDVKLQETEHKLKQALGDLQFQKSKKLKENDKVRELERELGKYREKIKELMKNVDDEKAKVISQKEHQSSFEQKLKTANGKIRDAEAQKTDEEVKLWTELEETKMALRIAQENVEICRKIIDEKQYIIDRVFDDNGEWDQDELMLKIKRYEEENASVKEQIEEKLKVEEDKRGRLKTVAEGDQARWTPPSVIQAEAKENMRLEQSRYKLRYDKRRYRGLKLQVGDLVVMRKVPGATGQPTKTQARYRGPLVVTEVLPSDTYRVSDISGTRSGKKFNTTAHIAQLKVYKNPVEEESSEEESMEDDTEGEEETTATNKEVVKENTAGGDTASQCSEQKEVENEEYNRPRRKTKKPLYLRDYVQTSE